MAMAIGLNLFILLAAAAGIVLLQVFLSRREAKWFGLLLPALSFLVSILIVVSMVAYTNIGITSRSVSENGVIVYQEVEDTRQDFGAAAGQVIISFLLYNIPTVVLIAIYAACRERRKRRLEIEKMRVQDLE